MKEFAFVLVFLLVVNGAYAGKKKNGEKCPEEIAGAAKGSSELAPLLWFGKESDQDVEGLNLGALTLVGQIAREYPEHASVILSHIQAIDLRGSLLWDGYNKFAHDDLHAFVMASVTEDPTLFRALNEIIKGLHPDGTKEFPRVKLEIVTLRTGKQVPQTVANSTFARLKELFGQMPGMLAVYEIREKSRNPRHEYFGTLQQVLEKAALVTKDGSVPEVIKKIVLASIDGESLEMRLVNPLKK